MSAIDREAQREDVLAKILYTGMAANERLDRIEQLLLLKGGAPATAPRFSLRRALGAFVRALFAPLAPAPPVSPFPPPRQEVF